MDDAPVPVTVVTGFLGAGKTTLLQQWLGAYARDEVAVIVNELGAVGIDAEMLAERARSIREITGGCACCTTHGELVRALEVFATSVPAPKRIFVETSGAASPAGVVRALLREGPAQLDGIVTVVDASRPLPDDALASEQIGYADVVVLSHVDRSSPESIAEFSTALAARNPTALVAHGENGALRESSLDELLARRIELPKEIASSNHEDAIESLALRLDGEVDDDRFGDWVEQDLARFSGRLLRIKGVLAVSGLETRMILQGVTDRLEVTFGAPFGDEPRACRLVLIGFGLERDVLAASFAATAAS